MRGYLQRLVASRAAPVTARPALPSRSPIAEADQRLGVASIADAVAAFAPEAEAPQSSPPPAESRTVPSHRTRDAARPAEPARVSRYAMPMPVVVPSAAPPPPAAPRMAAEPRAPVSSPAQVATFPAALAVEPISAPVPARAAAAGELDDPPLLPVPFMPHPAVPAVPAVNAPRPPAAAEEAAPAPVRPQAATIPERPAATVLAPLPLPPRPLPPRPPREHATASEIRLPPERVIREIELTGAEPLHAPAAPQQRVIVRETIRTQIETPQKPQPTQQKAPRTAAEASVIGPLPGPDLARARVELWLR